MSTWNVLSCVDSNCGKFVLQASVALSPNVTSDFQLPSKNQGSLAILVCSVV